MTNSVCLVCLPSTRSLPGRRRAGEEPEQQPERDVLGSSRL